MSLHVGGLVVFLCNDGAKVGAISAGPRSSFTISASPRSSFYKTVN